MDGKVVPGQYSMTCTVGGYIEAYSSNIAIWLWIDTLAMLAIYSAHSQRVEISHATGLCHPTLNSVIYQPMAAPI